LLSANPDINPKILLDKIAVCAKLMELAQVIVLRKKNRLTESRNNGINISLDIYGICGILKFL